MAFGVIAFNLIMVDLGRSKAQPQCPYRKLPIPIINSNLLVNAERLSIRDGHLRAAYIKIGANAEYRNNQSSIRNEHKGIRIRLITSGRKKIREIGLSAN